LSVSLSDFIKTSYSNYLNANFQLSNSEAISSNKKINYCKVIPFKINSFNQVEELVDYEIVWKKQASSQRITSTTNFKSNSVLASGNWYKIAIVSTGVHKITRSFFTNAGIPIAGINPKNIRIYGNGGQQLAEKNINFRYDDLEENAIEVVGEGDNSFDVNDYILFYAKGTTTWQKTYLTSGLIFKHFNNIYSDTAFYYINFDLGPGKRINAQSSLTNPSNVTTSTYDYYTFHELDKTNFVKSGRNFYGEYMDFTTSYNFSYNDNNYIVGDTIRAECTIAGRGSSLNTYNVNGNGINFNIACNGLNLSNYLEDYAFIKTGEAKALNNNPNTISFTISKQTANAVGYIDKLTINARRGLTFNGSQFSFRDLRITNPGNICEYQLTAGNTSNINIWNVTDQIKPYKQLYNVAGNNVSYIASSDSLNEYVIFNDFNLPQPVYYGTVPNQNLHALQQADYIIVTPPQFLPQANRLALLHQQNEGLSYAVVTTNQVYNEFGSGKADAAAIRDFTRMLYTRGAAISKPTKYLLLFGRGSYYNKNGRAGNSNFIPTYQSENSVSVIYSVASDDFYSLMDDNEGELAESFGGMDLGVGRLIVYTPTQAEEVTQKIENYYRKGGLPPTSIDNCNISEKNQLMGDWRNFLLFCADDGDLALHMSQADNLS
ncbi:MAG: type IX secretion system sortase PorU, partial [Bacteroidia bacterium]|nr:type IX secretion system sortase PorU [Bacteroidia bacterium]